MIRDYQTEILTIIQQHGDKLTGFNKLKKLGSFHPTSLSENLKELDAQNRILISKTQKGKPTTFSLVKSHYSTKIKINDSKINKIEKILDEYPYLSEDQKSFLVSCILQIAVPKIRNIPFGEISLELVDNYPMPKHELKNARIHYMNVIKRNLKRLYEHQRRILINSFFEKEQPKQVFIRAQNSLKLSSSA